MSKLDSTKFFIMNFLNLWTWPIIVGLIRVLQLVMSWEKSVSQVHRGSFLEPRRFFNKKCFSRKKKKSFSRKRVVLGTWRKKDSFRIDGKHRMKPLLHYIRRVFLIFDEDFLWAYFQYSKASSEKSFLPKNSLNSGNNKFLRPFDILKSGTG